MNLSALHSKARQQHVDQLQSSYFGYLKQWRHSVQAPALEYACRILGRLVQPALNPVKIKASCYLIICTATTPPSCNVGAQSVTRGQFLSLCCIVRSTHLAVPEASGLEGCTEVVLPACSLLVLFQSCHSFVSSSQTLWYFSLPLSSPCSGREDRLRTGIAWIYFICFLNKWC